MRTLFQQPALFLSIASFLACSAFAQKPWEKPVNNWTDADARRILSDSPWSKKAVARCGSKSVTVFVRLESAEPVRAALLRTGQLPVGSDATHHLGIAVLMPGKGVTECGSDESSAGAANSAILHVPNQPEYLKPVEIRVLREDDAHPLVLFVFMKTAVEPQVFRLPGVVLHSTQLSFSAHIGNLELKSAFPLHDMLYCGKFEL